MQESAPGVVRDAKHQAMTEEQGERVVLEVTACCRGMDVSLRIGGGRR